MPKHRLHIPDGATAQALSRELYRRAAAGYESAERWREAAECWTEMGDPRRAGELFLRGGDLERAAEALFDAGQAAAALDLYRRWQEALTEGDVFGRFRALLGETACLAAVHESRSAAPVRRRFRQARSLLDAEADRPGPLQASFWLALAALGRRLDRFDLVQEGFEQALASLPEDSRKRRLSAASSYLKAVRMRGDELLSGRLEELVATYGGVGEEAVRERQRIVERHDFRDGRHDVLHFTAPEQHRAWSELAEVEDDPEVDDFLRALAPPSMVYVPAGTFLMDPDDEEDGSGGDEPRRIFQPGYYMDRYPVTWDDYQRFVDADGYLNAEHWTPNGWQLINQRAWSGPRSEAPDSPRHPATGVSWFEAAACAAWAGKALPSERQWQKAAGWDPSYRRPRRYPWGDEWGEARCNTREAGLFRTVSVEQYSPQGDSAYGVADLGGNVNELCRSLFHQPRSDAEDPAREDSLCVCGASWDDEGSVWSRCAHRDEAVASVWSYDVGFRCVWPSGEVLPAADNEGGDEE